MRRIEKLKAKVVVDDLGIMEKPSGMHQRTFDRIEAEIIERECLAISALAETVAGGHHHTNLEG